MAHHDRPVPRLLATPLGPAARVFLIVAALLVLPTYFFPLWNMTMFAPQYPDGLRLDIFSHALVGGNDGQDVREINVLNHYIGMHDLREDDFTELQWMPFALGALALLFLRAAVHGELANLLDVLVLFLYFGAFSLWSFGYKLYHYGHDLAPTAPVKVEPFMPPMFGAKQLANFEVYSYPGLASYAVGLVALLLLAAFVITWRQGRRALAAEAAA